MKRCTIALILLCFPVGPALARTVTLVDRTPDGRCLRDGAALLVTINGEEERHSVDASTKLELTAAAAVRLEKKGCWSARVPEGEGGVVLDVYSSAEVGGQFTSKTPPEKLAGFVSLTAGSRSKPARFDGDHSIHCQLDYPNWSCVVPSGLPIDIRLEPGGFAPVHFFDVLAGTEAGRSMERQTLTRGASLAGWLETHDGASVEGARLTLVAAAGSTARAIAHTTSNKRGFFQFVGLPGGEFHLKSEASDRSPASLPVSVLAEQALMLPRPLVHVELVTLAVRLTPPVQEDGSKWRVALSEIPAAPNATVIQRPASDEGLWQASGLAAGMWRLSIKDRENSVVEETTIDLSRGSPADELSIDIASIEVTGSVKVGGKGLASAEVKFVNRAGKRVRAETDDVGHFRASFPTRGEWTPMVRAERDRGAEIRAETVLIPESDSPTIEVVLPLGRIVGEVVD